MLGGQSAGRPIAVKVVDPRLKRTVDLDLSLMRAATILMELVPRLHWLSLHETVNEFGRLMETQVRGQIGVAISIHFSRRALHHAHRVG